MRSILVILALFWAVQVTCLAAQRVELVDYGCSVTLPNGVEWITLPQESMPGPQTVLMVVSASYDIMGRVAVVDLAIPDEKSRKEFLAGHQHGLRKGGFVITQTLRKDMEDFPGYVLAMKGSSNGASVVQTTWMLFARDKVYLVSGGLLGDEPSVENAQIAAAFVASFGLMK